MWDFQEDDYITRPSEDGETIAEDKDKDGKKDK